MGKAKVDAENAEIAKRNKAQLDHKKSVEAENAAITKRNAEGQAKVDAENVAIDDFKNNKHDSQINLENDFKWLDKICSCCERKSRSWEKQNKR